MCASPSPFPPFLFFYVPQIKSNSQPAMSSSSQGIRLCRHSFQQPVASSPPRAAPPDGCVSAGDPVIPAARCLALERSPCLPLPSPAGDGKPSPGHGGNLGRSMYMQLRKGSLNVLDLRYHCIAEFPQPCLVWLGFFWFFFFFQRRMNGRALWGQKEGNLRFLARFFVVEYLKKNKIFFPM